MDKVILNDGTSLNFSSINILKDGIAFTFADQTIDSLKTKLTEQNLSQIELQTSAGDQYATYNNLTCLSIALIIADNSVLVTLYQKDSTSEEIATLKQQVAEMLMAMVRGGLI